MRLAHYTPNGRIEGFYVPGMHSDIPSATIEITDDEWRAILAAPGDYRVDGDALVHDPAAAPPIYADATAAERAVVSIIDAATRQITGIIPDDEKTSWPIKLAAAQAYKDGVADAAQSAMLSAEAGKTGEAVDDLADLILARGHAYAAAIAPLTGIRRAAQRDLAAASDAGALEQIVDAAAGEIDAVLAAVLAAQQG